MRRLTYDEFVVLHGNDPNWIKLQESPCFEGDLRRALAGDAAGLREIVLCARELEIKPQIIRALWMAGVPVRPHRNNIKRIWKVKSSLFVEVFAEDLDDFLRDVGFGLAKLPNEFDVWRGGNEPIEKIECGRSWTYSYSIACAFALQNALWRNVQGEQLARELSYPEPLVLVRRLRREHVAAWIGGLEREVILTNDALALPARPCGSVADWRRHRARKQGYFSLG